MKKYYSNGKLLISGEYLVLDGAVSLALPSKYGQSLDVLDTDSNTLEWKSYNQTNDCWFDAIFNLSDFEIITSDLSVKELAVANTLQNILRTTKKLNSDFLNHTSGVKVNTNLTFPNEWGLGTSSTLINNIASWGGVNAFELLEKSFGGSGYDIACAHHNNAITYQRNNINPKIINVAFNPIFKDQLFFVYLNEKQDSKEGIKMYRSLSTDKSKSIEKINHLTQSLIKAKNIQEFEMLLAEHETVIADLLKIQTVKQKLFSDFKGVVKSLGAWGGDFVMVTGKHAYVQQYFKSKNYHTILKYDDMILI